MGLATRNQIIQAAGAALAAAALGGFLLAVTGWINIVTAGIVGFGIGSAAFYASRRHRDATIQGIAGAMALCSVILAAVIMSLAAGGGSDGAARAILASSYEFFLPPALAAMAGAVLRFFL